METLAVARSSFKHYRGREVNVVLWTKDDPFPQLGPSVGIDTETEPITDTMLDPPVVVLGCFDPASATCYIMYWPDIPAFMQQLCERDIQQRYFNVGFDEPVIDKEDTSLSLLMAVEQGRVRDMQIRTHLNEIATLGYIRGSLFSLAGCTKQFEGVELDKGDGTENSDRLSFRRSKSITESQARYLAFDCISTWCVGEAVPEQPTEVTHTKGMIVLYHISINGFPVDMTVYQALVDLLWSDKDKWRNELVKFGFPDPYRDDKKELDEMKSLYRSLCKELFNVEVQEDPKKGLLRLLLVYMYNYSDGPEEVETLMSTLAWLLEGHKMTIGKQIKELYNRFCEDYDLVGYDESSKAYAMLALVTKMLQYIRDNRQKIEAEGLDIKAAVDFACGYLEDHAYILEGAPELGPRKFFQQYVRKLLVANCPMSPQIVEQELARRKNIALESNKEFTESDEMEALVNMSRLKLDLTEKSGEVKLTKQDMWKLKDLGIKDKFLEAYTGYNHADKYLTTYMKPEYIRSDNKVHAKYENLKRTGRTSCVSPNLQNLPSRSDIHVKNMFTVPKNAILCATDYHYLELCGFAQSCYTRFGFSVMRDVINSGIDPHFWFAGIMKGIIDNDLSKADDPEWVAHMVTFLEENVSKLERQGAKFANFGQRKEGRIKIAE